MEKEVTANSIFQTFWARMQYSSPVYTVTITDTVKNFQLRFALGKDKYESIAEIAVKFGLKDISGFDEPTPFYSNESRTITMDVRYLELWTS